MTEPEADANYVDVLTNTRDGTVFGYRLVGASAGPQVAVLGTCAAAELAFDRLMHIPTLPWMKGNLILIQLDALDDALSQIDSLVAIGPIDRTITLPRANQGGLSEAEIRHHYQTILRACTELGMISGRGVPPATPEEDAA
ncbi:hypothetical protein [Marinovum sp. KMM 9879]